MTGTIWFIDHELQEVIYFIDDIEVDRVPLESIEESTDTATKQTTLL